MLGARVRPPAGDRQATRLDPFWSVPPRLPPPLARALRAAEGVYHRRHCDHPALLKRRGRKGIRPIAWKRAERAEIHARALRFLISRCDLFSLNVGRVAGGDLVVLDVEQLADAMGVGLRRCSRVLSDLVAAGYVWRHQHRELLDDGSYRGWVAETKLTFAAFAALGVTEAAIELHRKLHTAAQRKRVQRRRWRAPVQRSIGAALGGVVGSMLAPALGTVEVPLDDNDRRRLLALQLQVRAELPELPADAARAEALRRLRDPPD